MLSFTVDEHIKLELPLIHHAEEIAAVVRANLGRLQVWMPWACDDYSVGSAREFIRRNLKSLAEEGSFGLIIRCDEKFAGTIGFHNLDLVNRSAHIGYWIAQEFEGRGIISLCCRSLIDHLFTQMKLNRVQINCNVENVRSRGVPERLGFKLEGIHRQVEYIQGKFGDWAIYAMLAEEWMHPVTK
jgi:ribosomal-protein-serine acetyltransferase